MADLPERRFLLSSKIFEEPIYRLYKFLVKINKVTSVGQYRKEISNQFFLF